jgi:predicted alpha/beta-hydrolase family hydrolase
MEVIGLPGRNKETEDWLRHLLASLALGASEVVRYRHWGGNTDPNIMHETEALRGRAVDLVVAKSMGTIVAATACSSVSFQPARAVLIGSPIAGASPELRALYRSLAERIPTLFIQQTADFTGAFAELKSVVERSSNAHLVEVPGKDHVYADTAALGSVIAAWVGRS